MYLYKDGKHRDILMFWILKSYVANSNGNQDPEYGTKVLNLVLCISFIERRALRFVSTNICSIFLRHVNCMIANYIQSPFVLNDKNDVDKKTVVVNKIKSSDYFDFESPIEAFIKESMKIKEMG